MNKDLALKISKHSMIKRLLESVDQKEVARLIAEELMDEADNPSLKSAIAGMRRDAANPEKFLKKYVKEGEIVYPYTKLSKLPEEDQRKYREAVDALVKKIQDAQSKEPQDKEAAEKKEAITSYTFLKKLEEIKNSVYDKMPNIEDLKYKENTEQYKKDIDTLYDSVSKQMEKHISIFEELKKDEKKMLNFLELGDKTEALKDSVLEIENNINTYKHEIAKMFINARAFLENPQIKEKTKEIAKEVIQTKSKASAEEVRKEVEEKVESSEIPEEIKEKAKEQATALVLYRTVNSMTEIVKKYQDSEFMKGVEERYRDSVYKLISLIYDTRILKEAEGLGEIGAALELLNPTQEQIDQLKSKLEEKDLTILKIVFRKLGHENFVRMLKGESFAPPESKEQPEADSEKPAGTFPPSDTEQPDKFDLDDEQDKELKAAAKKFINEFYEQQYLFQQGQIVKELLSVLLSIKSGEEKEKAAKTSKEKKKIEEQEEDKLEASKGRLRSIQISFRTFLRDIKVAKKALKNFQEVADKGSIVASSTKKDFIKLLQRQQRDIVTLFNALTDAYIKRLDEAEASKGETELKWKRIEDYYDIASEKLRSLLGLSNDNELRNSILLIDETIDALRELTKEFPNVNPFGRKDDNYDQFGDEYDNAIENVKSVSLQPILELTRTGSGSQSAVERALEGLKEFSQQIERIFGVKSQFGGAPKKKDPAAEAGEEKSFIQDTGFPRELPQTIKDFLDEYKRKYSRVKAILDKNLFKESIEDEFEQLKQAFLQADKMVDMVTKDFRDIMIAAKDKDEARQNFRKTMEMFVNLYEEIEVLYKRATDKPSLWQKYWPKIKEGYNKFAQVLKDIYDTLGFFFDKEGFKLDLKAADTEGGIDDLKTSDDPTQKPTDVFVTDDIENIKTALKKENITPSEFGKAFDPEGLLDKDEKQNYLFALVKFLLILKAGNKTKSENLAIDMKPGIRAFFDPRINQPNIEKALEQMTEEEKKYIEDIFINEKQSLNSVMNLVKKVYSNDLFAIDSDEIEDLTADALFSSEDSGIEEQIANKLKPLIKEMLRRNK